MGIGFQSSQELTYLVMMIDRIRVLDLSKNPLGDKSIIILMHGVKRSKSIIRLNLSSTELSHKGSKRIFKSLCKNQSLVSLSLGCVEGVYKNRIGERGLDYLGDLLKENKYLSILDISSNRIMDEGFNKAVQAISGTEILDSLNVSNNEIT